MTIDLRRRRVHLPVIPSSSVVRQRLQEVQDEARKLSVLLRLATELEQDDTSTSNDAMGVERG